ncbi:hypothetical protein ACH4F6_10070 [Streptomyces sp. NPDC017936]|uniref:hypothetical protein n=1 Tax=Streptomyces sp. NPDC017936 TaxID=3365016 RepID=UPI003798A1E4
MYGAERPHDHRSPVPHRRPARAVRAALAAACVALPASVATGCGDAGGLQGAGPTPTAVGPEKLWPDLPPASSPAFDIGEVNTKVVKGVAVPGDDVRRVDPVAVVRTEIAASPDEYGGAGTYAETSRRMADCATGAGERGRCPVLRPYYRDLTGDGRDELTLGFRQLPGDLTAVRVYTVDRHRLVQVMGWEDAVSGVELAARSVIIRSPSEVAGYEYRLQWTWDPDQRAMLLTHDEMLRSGGRKQSPRPPASPAPSASPSSSPSVPTAEPPSPSVSVSVSASGP